MKDRQTQPLTYKLVLEKPRVDKFFLGGRYISKFSSRPLRPLVDFLLMHKPTSAPTNRAPNAEVFQCYEDNWLNFGVRTAAQLLDRPKKLEEIDDGTFSSIKSRELKSGVTKVTSRVKGRKVSAFLAPPHFVPYSFRTMDLFPDKDEHVAVSASLRKIAKTARRSSEFPAIAMTAASWNSMVIHGDIVYLKSLDSRPVEEHVRRHIKETAVGIDTRSGDRYFTFDDFFDTLYNQSIPAGETDRTTKTPLLPGMDAYWLVTKNDGNIRVMSATELKSADEGQSNFKNTIASITSTTAFVNETVADKYANRKDLPVQLVNAVVLFTVNGERRIGSVHGTINANAITVYKIAKHMIDDQFPKAEDIEVGVIDGGGSAGAIVQKRKNWMNTQPTGRRFDRSTLPLWAIEHEIPVYTGFVPQKFVTEK